MWLSIPIYCQEPQVEDISRIFMMSPTTQFIWKYFSRPMGINIQNLEVTQVINNWWDMAEKQRIKYIFQIVPATIFRDPWKMRNTLKDGRNVSNSKLVYQIIYSLACS